MRWLRLLRLAAVVALVVPSRCQEEDDEDDEGDMDVEEESLSSEQLRGLHAKIDANSDGKASLKEVMDFSAQVAKDMAEGDIDSIVEEVDTSKDGKLSLEEHLEDWSSPWDESDAEEVRSMEVRRDVEKAKFAAADANADGLLDRSEIPSLFYPELHDGVMQITVREALRQKDTNGDGKLDHNEFWEIDAADGDAEMLEDEQSDFQRLDTDRDGFISEQELKYWESGKFHVEDSMQKLFEIADSDADMHVTADELVSAREKVGATDAHFHLVEWAEHHEL